MELFGSTFGLTSDSTSDFTASPLNCVGGEIDAIDATIPDMAKDERPKPDPNLGFEGIGRPAGGLYPHVSRTKLAEITGLDKTTISGILRGRTAAKLEVAYQIARAAGVSIEQLISDLAKKREQYEQQHKTKGKRKT